MARYEINIREKDIPQAPGEGSDRKLHAAHLGVPTGKVTITLPLEEIRAIDQASRAAGAVRMWTYRALVRQIVEEGEIVTGVGRAKISEFTNR